MKTIRTIIATLSAVLLTFALVAWFSVRRNAAFIQRTIYQGFDQTFVVALVMGCAFLLIAIILTVAIVSTDEEDEDEEDEEPVRPKKRPQAPAQKRPAPDKGEQPYRRVTRTRTMDQARASGDEDGFARPKAEGKPAPKKRPQAAQRPDDMTIRGEAAPVRKERKAPAPVSEPAEAPAPEKKPETPAEAPAPEKKPETPAEAPAEAPEIPVPEQKPKAPAPEQKPEAPAAEGTVRCVFCGSEMSRDSQVCPNCGKKR